MIFTKSEMKKKREQVQQIIDDIQRQFDLPGMTDKESNSERGRAMAHMHFMLEETIVELNISTGL